MFADAEMEIGGVHVIVSYIYRIRSSAPFSNPRNLGVVL